MKIYKTNEPEFVGNFPVRHEIEVIPTDSDNNAKIGWFVREYSGAEVFALDESGNPIESPLTNKEDLYPGKEIWAPTLVGPCKAKIVADEDGELFAISNSGGTLIMLEFAQDDRICWTTSGAINLRGVKKLEKSSI